MAMKMRLAILVALLALLLVGSTALAQPGEPAAVAPYTFESAVSTGGGYRLAGGSWQVSGIAGGPGYRLDTAGHILQGAGCCCTYLPCTMNNY